ncbi:antibiotic biosynthesis monooxygenase [Mycolicibacterium neoaurum]|uniref:putative quinol monooxygenase n=1 Tax=Mycolicibacterium neoaurum TaxID=1795 RepID=UPI001BCE65BB|nr:putative quinol monooxygenase [Mycolicibacterium neoaurum]QVI27215.1 antibiotic biosynthesis monooxygenase [Mycolicibacterium neoaurum]
MLALIVKLDIHAEHRDAFLAAAQANRAACLRDEPGCLHFDIAEDNSVPHRFYFYEIYRDNQALDDHRDAAHFTKWRETAARVVVPGSQVNSVAHLIPA